MSTKTCPTCRSVNPGSAVVCVNCGTQIGEVPRPGDQTWSTPPAPPSRPGWGEPSEQGQGAPPLPPMPAGPDADPAWGTAVETTPARPARSGLVLAAVLAVVVIGAGLAWVATRGGGDSFPDSLAGQPRNRSDMVQQMEDLFSSFQLGDIRIRAAVYGSDTAPASMIMVFDGLPDEALEGSSEDFFSSFGSQVVPSAQGSIDMSSAAEETRDGVDYLCAPFQGATSTGFGTSVAGTMCVFRGDAVGLVMFISGAPQPNTAIGITEEAYHAIA
jgi:hypothetical protein